MIRPIASFRRYLAANAVSVNIQMIMLNGVVSMERAQNLVGSNSGSISGSPSVYDRYVHTFRKLSRQDLFPRTFSEGQPVPVIFDISSEHRGPFGRRSMYPSGSLEIFTRPGAEGAEGHDLMLFPVFHSMKAKYFAELVIALSLNLIGAKPYGLLFYPEEPHSIFLWSTDPDGAKNNIRRFLEKGEICAPFAETELVRLKGLCFKPL